MKKTIIIMSILLIIVLMIPVILISIAFGISPQFNESFYGGMKIKYDRIRAVNGRKIVVIGGSSVAFGLRSDIMEKELCMPVVNFGLYANLGTKYMLDVAEDYINEGDIVIIAPEQNKQALSLFFNAEAVWYSADGNYEVLTELKADNIGDMSKAFLSFLSDKYEYWRNGSKPCPDGPYNVYSFNRYGDIEFKRDHNILPNEYDKGMLISFEKNVIDIEFINYVNDYNIELSNRGANVFFSFCPMNNLALSDTSDSPVQNQYYDYISEKFSMPILGNPASHLLDSEWFYDSNFHLNDAGSIYYTLLLAQELKAAINDFSPLQTDIPQKPKKNTDNDSAYGTVSEDLVEAAKIFDLGGVDVSTVDGKVIFTGNWIINGLTDYGESLSEILIPDDLAGLPVVEISEACFKNNATVSKITFGKNIHAVGADAFENCVNLKGIYITSLDPDTFHPSPDIFDGLKDCFFYIPNEVLSKKYVTNYFWGAFADKMKEY